MSIKDWFDNGCKYFTGLDVYEAHPKHNRHLLFRLKRKESRANLVKLKYELKKLQNTDTSVKVAVVASIPVKEKNIVVASQKTFRPLKISDLPSELHELFIKQKNDFYKACSLKVVLNDLPATAENKALELCLEIENLFDSIEATWKIFDHYRDYKEVLPFSTAKTFTNYTPVQLLKAEKSKRESISKAKSALNRLEKQLASETNMDKQNRLTNRILKKQEAIVTHETALCAIIELSNKKK